MEGCAGSGAGAGAGSGAGAGAGGAGGSAGGLGWAGAGGVAAGGANGVSAVVVGGVGGETPVASAVAVLLDPSQAARRTELAQARNVARDSARKPVEFILKNPRLLCGAIGTSPSGRPVTRPLKGKVKGLNKRPGRNQPGARKHDSRQGLHALCALAGVRAGSSAFFRHCSLKTGGFASLPLDRFAFRSGRTLCEGARRNYL